MAEIAVNVLEGNSVDETHVVDPTALEAAVDADIAAFDQYFQEVMKNDPLVASEKAMLKTYLWFKTHGGEVDGSSPAEPESPSDS